MANDSGTHRKLTVWLGIVGLLLLLLAAGLPDLTLDDGTDYAGNWRFETALGEVNVLPFIYFALVLQIVIIMIYLRNRTWTNFWRTMGVVGLFLVAMVAFITFMPAVEIEPEEEEREQLVEEELVEPETAESLSDPQPFVEVAPFEPTPEWVGLLTGVVVVFFMLAFIVGVAFAANRFLPGRPEREELEEPLDEVARQAQTAVYALQQGKPLADVVLRCYADMEQTVRTDQGIVREDAMTVREFERRLLRLGLPGEAVGTLIQLFETVRYGRYTPRPEDQTRAINSLTQIVAASGRLASDRQNGAAL
jgi:hypothetical protein